MKSLKSYIQERLIIRNNKYNYFPKTKQELQDIIKMVKVGYQEDNKLINNLNKLINEALEK